MGRSCGCHICEAMACGDEEHCGSHAAGLLQETHPPSLWFFKSGPRDRVSRWSIQPLSQNSQGRKPQGCIMAKKTGAGANQPSGMLKKTALLHDTRSCLVSSLMHANKAAQEDRDCSSMHGPEVEPRLTQSSSPHCQPQSY